MLADENHAGNEVEGRYGSWYVFTSGVYVEKFVFSKFPKTVSRGCAYVYSSDDSQAHEKKTAKVLSGRDLLIGIAICSG